MRQETSSSLTSAPGGHRNSRFSRRSILQMAMLASPVLCGGLPAEAATGGLLWKDEVAGSVAGGDANSGARRNSASVIGMNWGMVFAAGTLTNSRGNSALTVRAYDAATGSQVWSSQSDDSKNRGNNLLEAATGLVANDNGLFVAGALRNPDGGADFVIRRYDPATGSLVWEDRAGGPIARSYSKAFALVADGGRVFATGSVGNAKVDDDLVVRALDARTGSLLWQDSVPGRSLGGLNGGYAAAAQDGRLFVGGTLRGRSGGLFTVRAYDAATGFLLWKDRAEGTSVAAYNAVTALAVAAGRVFVAGTIRNADDGDDTLLRAYEAETGELIWEQTNPGVPTRGTESISGLVARGGQVFVSGTSKAFDGGGAFTVRAYNAATGTLSWEDRVNGSVLGTLNRALSLAVEQDQVISTGFLTDGANEFVFVVRAYDAAKGGLKWEDRAKGSGKGGFTRGQAIVATGAASYVAGTVGDTATGKFTVRAYQAR